jgi:hypothetical protein
LVRGEEVEQAMRRVVDEEHLMHPVRLWGFRGAARKEVSLVSKELGFHVFRVRGDGLREFSALLHGRLAP